jgi:hypothetical protein
VNQEIQTEAARRGITRLCHFTPSRNLAHILLGTWGILATKHLKRDERALFNATDLSRLDRHEGHICCSVEYPNAWYFEHARGRELLFRDWVVVLFDPRYLWEMGTLFCPRNAAASFGRQLGEGTEAFRSLFAASVEGAHGQRFGRRSMHLSCSPTDDQAEVLIPDRVALRHVRGFIVASETQGKNELSRLRLAGLDISALEVLVSPTAFQKRALSECIRSGRRPVETPLNQGIADE